MAVPAAHVRKQLASPREAPRRMRLHGPLPEPPRRGWRRMAGALLLVLSVGGGVAGWHWWKTADLFPLQTVRLVTPLQHLGEAELRRAIEPHVGRGMLVLDVGAVRAALEELPWVASAGVRRRWPATLEIAVVEQVAQARWNGDGVLNPEGVAFWPDPDSIPPGLPMLAGPPGSELEVMARYHALDALLAPLGLQLTGLTLDGRLAWKAVLNGEIEMQLGAGDGEAEVQRFVRAYPRLSTRADSRLAAVDLRYPNGFALRWQGEARERGISQ